METMMKVVQFSADNIMKCQCTSCPVQGESSCAMDKMKAMSGMMEKMKSMMASGQQGMAGGGTESMSAMPDMTLPEPKDVPGLYCSSGAAVCGDLDYTKGCVCPTCQVQIDNQLNNTKYCSKGSAAHVG